jgi:RimJ/RimL family protein N-acetyltransferase
MYVERTYDAALLKSVALHPGVRDLISDRGEEPAIVLHESIYWLLPRYEDGGQFQDGSAIGFVAFMPVNSITWNPHIAILPEHRGRGVGTEAMSLAIGWMFAHTACKKIVAYPPVTNLAMVRVFEKCGLRHEGVCRRSFLYHGQIYDRLAMGMEKD